MKIGLVRHFKVRTEEVKDEIDWKEYKEIMEAYDNKEILIGEVDLKDIAWNKCYSSTLPRAVKTAKSIFNGEIKRYDEIKEVDMRVISPVRGKNNMAAWSIYSFLGWAKNQVNIGEGIDESRKRVNKFLDILEDQVEEEDNILVVCHGMIMTVLEEELIKRGFLGYEDIVFPSNGDLYIYEK